MSLSHKTACVSESYRGAHAARRYSTCRLISAGHVDETRPRRRVKSDAASCLPRAFEAGFTARRNPPGRSKREQAGKRGAPATWVLELVS